MKSTHGARREKSADDGWIETGWRDVFLDKIGFDYEKRKNKPTKMFSYQEMKNKRVQAVKFGVSCHAER